jgi:hypothetical protein
MSDHGPYSDLSLLTLCRIQPDTFWNPEWADTLAKSFQSGIPI